MNMWNAVPFYFREQVDPPPGGAPADPPPPATPPAGSPGPEWIAKSIYDTLAGELANTQTARGGAQANYQKEKDAREALQAKYSTLQTEFAAKEKALADLMAGSETNTTKLTDVEKKLAEAEAARERITVIASEFPHLLVYLGKDAEGNPIDLLPKATGDELRKQLGLFSERALASGTPPPTPPVVKPPGQTPPPPGSGTAQPETAEALLAKAKQHFAKNEVAEYDAVMKQYSAALVAKT